ncbi:GDSL-type esterase/lipase family protein [Salinibacterium soli]|uniref:SGNH/GDSL hydrolase family protein n=1 Tax=Antiquaquibacter soli TaxID=3064523 RepID=A0ABT9BQH1_9MICO|nr:GDSL-type esterase/lipase family protein [Protaetiibacter sp. WY-16]MDO7881562.1 SGNH/GDSL hydrolase family protein [Protaetiibacter sp. WY-16]
MLETPLDRVRDLVRGAVGFESGVASVAPLRLPEWTRSQQFDPWIERWSAQSLGVHLSTRSAASVVELDIEATRILPPGESQSLFPAAIVAEVDGVVVDRVAIDEGPVVRTLSDRTAEFIAGPAVTVRLDLGAAAGERDVVVWLPHNARAVIHAVRSDAPLDPPRLTGRRVWLHHGSSVSHGIEADGPLGPWPQQAARSLGLDIVDLAIAGNAQLDPFVARTLASIPADVVSLKLGVNVVNGDTMRARAFVPALHGFLDIVRDGHPGIPILVCSPIACPAIEETPGPTAKGPDGRYRGTDRLVVPGDGTLTLSVVRHLVRSVVEARDDSALYYDDGLELFGLDDAALLWDGLHPDQRGYDLIARRFVDRARSDTPTGRAFAPVLR